jgi:hypothetical protein
MLKRIAMLSAVGCLCLGFVGCGSDSNNVSYGHIVQDPHPELQSTAMTHSDADRSFWYMANSNGRMLYDDVLRSLYLDQPSRLSPYPITYRNGQPR